LKLRFGDPNLGFDDLKLRFGDPKLRFGNLKLRFGDPKLRFGNLKLGFGDPKLRFGNLKLRFGDPKLRFSNLKLRFSNLKLGFGDPKLRFGNLKCLEPIMGICYTAFLSQNSGFLMRFLLHRDKEARLGALTRSFAVFFAVLYVLSAVRGFVPGMCATQSALAKRDNGDYTQVCTVQQGNTCCTRTAVPASKTSEQDTPSPSTSCVFCMISKARVEAPEHYHFEAPLFTPGVLRGVEPALALSFDAPRALNGRAPPVA